MFYFYRFALVALAFACAVVLAVFDHASLAGITLVAGVWRTVRA